MILLALIILGTALEGIGIASVFVLISVINDIDSISKFGMVQNAAAWLELEGSSLVVFLSIAIAGFVLGKNAYLYLVIRYRARFVNDGIARDGSRLLSKYLGMPYEDFIKRNTADYTRNVFLSVRTVHNGVLTSFVEFVSEILVVIVISLILLFAEPAAALVSFLFVGTVFAAIYGHVGARMMRLGEERHRLDEAVLKTINHSLDNFRDIKLLHIGGHFIGVFGKMVTRHADNFRAAAILTQLPRLVFESILPVGIVLVVIVTEFSGTRDQVLPLLALFAVSAMRILPSFNRIVGAVNGIKQGIAALNEVAPDIKDMIAKQLQGEPPPPESGIPFANAVTIEEVRYGYGVDGAEATIKGVTTEIRFGQSVGLVGASGAGKSTLADLLLGLLRPDAGRILIDGEDIAEHMLDWQRLLGVVPQSINFLDDTLRRNVAIGVDDADISQADLEEALTKAQLQETIDNLPDGLDTIIGERGVKLSGGQRQRIGIARALYRKPKVLILDEATSALDLETEWEVNQSIRNLQGQVTLIVIAHRLSTVRDCGKLIFLDDGVIIDEGTYDELYVRCAPFTRLVDRGEFSGADDE